jgi:hypothetical protein
MKNNQQEVMAVHIEQWSSSGLSKANYCKQEGLTYHKFLYHLKRNQKESIDTGFTMIETKSIDAGCIELHLPNGCYFSLRENCSITVLQNLVRLC